MDEAAAVAFLRRRRRRALFLQIRRRLQDIRNASNPFILAEERFMGMYRLSKQLVIELVEELRQYLPIASRTSAVSPELKVVCALHFFGQGSYQKSAGSDIFLGLSQSSVSRFVEEVTEALNAPEVLAKWIPFPLVAEQRMELIQKNYRASGFPGAIGFIDGTHVSIRAPTMDELKLAAIFSKHLAFLQLAAERLSAAEANLSSTSL